MTTLAVLDFNFQTGKLKHLKAYTLHSKFFGPSKVLIHYRWVSWSTEELV